MFDTDSPTDICGVGVQGGTLMGMTREEQNRKLKAFITCLKCEVSGKPCDDNCPTQYEAGNMGEIIENLETISKALEQDSSGFMTIDEFVKRKVNRTLDKLRAEILEEKECAYADFERYKVEYLGQDWEDVNDSLPQDDFHYGMERCIDIIDKYKAESEDKE